MSPQPLRILFVCMGNICRSPAGEGVLAARVKQAGWAHRMEIDSAGTIDAHQGELADDRMRAAAAKRGYNLTSRARQVTVADLDYFDLILTMDEHNRHRMISMAENHDQRARVQRFCDFCKNYEKTEVPDPYYGGEQGFEQVLDLLEDGCLGVLEWVQKRLEPNNA